MTGLGGLSPERLDLVFRKLREKRGTVAADRIAPRSPDAGPLPLSFSQQRLWFLDRLHPGSAAYNVPTVLHLAGRLDPAALEASLGEIARRHEALRTVFPAEAGEPHQAVLPWAPGEPSLSLVDLSELPDDRRRDEAEQRSAEETRRPFDLAAGPLLRAFLLRLGSEEHLLAAVQHHILSDAWSKGILIRELAALYAAFSEGRPSPLPELPVQYADFALWQRRVLAGDRLQGETGFWREALRGAPPDLALPADRPHPADRTDHGIDHSVRLSAETAAALRALALRSEATPFMVLLAALQALLSRWTGEADVSVGAPVAGRHRAEVEGLIGLFVNTVVMRTDLGGDPTFAELTARVRAVTLDAYAHQELPFEKLVEELAPERRLDCTPLFRVLFALQNTPRTALVLPGLHLELREIGSRAAKLDLTLILQEEGDGITGSLTLSADLFEPATAARLSAAFERLLAAAVERPALRLSELPLLGESERQALAVEWAGAEVPPLEPEACLGDLFKAQVERTPDAPSLFADSAEEEEDRNTLTYRELADRARELAVRLRKMGVGPGTVVGLCAERSPELVVGVLSVLEAGGAYLPLDPSYPRDRLALLMEDASAPVLLIQRRLLPLLPQHGARILLLDDSGGDPPLPTGSPPAVTPDDLAYVIYTSGSTGRPKGVAIPHRGVVNRLLQAQKLFRLRVCDAVLQKASIGFDFSVWEILAPLIAGALLVLARPGGHRDPAYLARLIAKRRVTVVHFVPSMLEAFLDREESGACGSLRLVLAGGEALSPALRDRCFDRLGCAFTNEYGPTEATIDATWSPLSPGEPGPVSIGRPIPGCTAHVLDRALSPVLPGTPGELLLGGVCLARGYLGRPDLTAERFVPSPFGRGERLYRSGDLARFRPDGRIDFLGRADHQVKIRGFRIEPGEVEAALRACPGVRDAAVLVLDEPGGGRRLAAFVRSGGEPPEANELRRSLEAQLPAFLVPSRITLLDSLPLNPHGKLDRGALARLEARDPGMEKAEEEAPATPAEELLAQIWCDLLGIESVGRHDGFFDLGGHSLLGVLLIARIREAFGVDIEVRTVFEMPTLADLAAAVTERLGAGAAPAERIVRQPREGDLPLSFAQERLWFLDQLGDAGAYVIPAAFRVRGALDPHALGRALAAVVRRHEALRTTFGHRDGRPYQVIDPEPSVLLPRIDLSGLPAGHQEGEVSRRLAEDARRPFDLARGPLLRALLLRLGAEDHAVSLMLHHIVSDGWSAGVLVRELSALYAAESPSLPELPVQYADYALWQRRTLDGERLAALLADGRRRLDGMPALALPGDRPRPALESFRGTRCAVEMPGAGIAAALRALGRGERATLFMTLLAAWQTLLCRYSGQDDFPVGTPVANRGHSEVQNLIGFFVNTLVLRADLSGDPPFRELLQRVRETALAAYAREELPFERLVEELRPERDLGRNPLFQVLFTLQEDIPAALRLGALGLEPIELGGETAKLDLTLVCRSGPDGELLASLEVSTDLFDAATGARMLEHFAQLLATAAADPGRRLSRLDILGEAERRQLLAEIDMWNQTASGYPRDATIHQLFEEQARLTPDRIALVDRDREITYAELDAGAERLARRLRLLGAGLETPVGAAFERTAEMIVAFLAALKVGGAYVPLDPSEPAERLAAMIREIAMPVILTEARLAIDFPPGPRVLALDRGPDSGELDTEGFVEPAATGLAYVMFTSGSTGRPKAVGVEHRGVVRLVRDTGFARLGPGEVFLQLAHPCFDVSTFEIWGALLNGGRLILYPGLVPTLAELGQLLERRRVTSLWLTAGLFHHVVEGGVEALRPVSQLVAGGDVLDPGAFRKVQETLPGCTVINGYGPTENTTFTCCWTADGLLPAGASVPIGSPIANTTAYVLDRWLEPVPAGVPGELLTGGDGVARGYLGRPDLTAERFVPDPFAGAASAGGRLYRTGDRVRLPPGRTNLEFLGRVDRQVKIRGFRLELEEVEAALRACAGIREAAVSVLGDVGGGSSGGRRIAAFVVRDEGTSDARELRRLLGTRLPPFMVPSRFMFLEELPLNPRGKVDRSALARIAAQETPEDLGEQTPDGAPRTPVEELLAQLWSDLLKAERVDRHDSFFDLGGHSLLTVRLIARVRETFGIDLAVRTIFETPTLAGLAASIAEQLGGEPAERLVRQPRDGEIPLSFAQERLWFLDQMAAAGAYVIPSAFRLRGALDAPALRLALAEIVRRHETLRTTFGHRNGRPYQIIAPAASVPLPVVDLSGLETEQREREADRQLAEEARRPFDLERGPLLRALLLRLGEEDAAVSLVLHHIVSDGWSAGVLVRELSALCSPGSPSLPELPVQYADYALWQRRTLAGERLAALLAGWRGRLDGMPALELPTDRPRPALESFRGARCVLGLPTTATAPLRALGRSERVTLFMTLLAAWQTLLGRYSGQDDFPIGTPVANRGQGEVQGLIGFFVNSLVLRAGLAGDPPFRELLRRVRETALAAYAHEELPFEKLVEELRPEHDRRDRHALFQVLFTLQEDSPGALRGLRLGALSLEPIRLGSSTAKLDLTLVCQGTEDGGLRASLEISTDLFDPTTGARMLDHFANLLRAVEADPGRPLSDLEILSEAERRQILAWGELAGPARPRDTPIHRLFEEQARLHPDRVALVDRDHLLTYGELADRAGRFARHLRGLGVGTDSLAGVALERSAEMVIACLGILAAGGAYVPLDPAEPRERLEAMIEEVGLRWLFSSSSAELLSLPVEQGLEEDEPPVGLAYVMFTSGSTGRPKAVGVEHRGVVRLVKEASYIRFGPEEVFLQLAPPAFDAATLEIWGPLLNGGRLVMFPGRVPSMAELGETLARHQVTTLWLTAGLFHQVVANGVEVLRPVSQLLAGGDVLDPDAVRRAREALPGCSLINGYGPTENTTFTCCWTAAALPPGASVPIGVPIDGTRVHVLDRSLRPVPLGVPGELLAGGDGLARGYLGRPDLTAERFVPDPFSGETSPPGARLYRTGDRVRRRGDGTLEILGRLDQQVKIRGFRVEPGEIEAVLAGHPEVSQAAVVVAEGRTGGKILAAYVVSQAAIERTCLDEEPAGREAIASELRRFLRRRLPEPMVPAVVVLDSLPLNANGKVDRAALSRRGDADAPAQAHGTVPPRSPIEEQMAGLWTSVLGVEPIGVHDDFFELGGHSLLGIQLLSRVRDAFGVDLGVQALFAAPTVAELTEALVERLVELADDEAAAAALEGLMELEPAPQGR